MCEFFVNGNHRKSAKEAIEVATPSRSTIIQIHSPYKGPKRYDDHKYVDGGYPALMRSCVCRVDRYKIYNTTIDERW